MDPRPRSISLSDAMDGLRKQAAEGKRIGPPPATAQQADRLRTLEAQTRTPGNSAARAEAPAVAPRRK
jgi:hypothetical protein